MFNLKQVSFSVAALGAILAVATSATPAQALNIVSGSFSGTWEDGFFIENNFFQDSGIDDSFTVNYTYDTDSLTTLDTSVLGSYSSINKVAPLRSLALNSGTFSYTFSLLDGVNDVIQFLNYQEEPSYGQGFVNFFGIVMESDLNDLFEYLYIEGIESQNSSGIPYYSYYASVIAHNYTLGNLYEAYTRLPIVSSDSATPVPTPALLPGLVGLGMAALRKRKENQGQEAAETAEV